MEGVDALDKLLAELENEEDEYIPSKTPESEAVKTAETTDDEVAQFISESSGTDNITAGPEKKEDSELPEIMPDEGEDFDNITVEEESADSSRDLIHTEAERTEIAAGVAHSNFTIKGTKAWNTREPYSMPVDPVKLQREYNELKLSFYFVGETVAQAKIQGEMKRAMIKFINGSSSNIIESYRDFIYKYVFIKTKEIVDYFGCHLKSSLFIYHLGVLTLYRIILESFHESDIGYCIKLQPGNKLMKFTPSEYLKDIVMNWFEENINIYHLSFDGISEFEGIKKTVTDKYSSRIDHYNEKIDEAVKRLKLNPEGVPDRNKIFKSKWKKWFGSANIAVYNRFVEKTMFKQI